jgi:hypothetical protein
MRAASVAFDRALWERGTAVPEMQRPRAAGMQPARHSHCEKNYSSFFVLAQEATWNSGAVMS